MRLRSSASMLSGEASAPSRLGGSTGRPRMAAMKRSPVRSPRLIGMRERVEQSTLRARTLGAEGREEDPNPEECNAVSPVTIRVRIHGLSVCESAGAYIFICI